MPVVNKMVFQDVDTRANTTTTITQNGPNVAALEARQEAVLARLRSLKAQLDQVKGNKVATTSPSVSATPAVGAAAHASPLKKSTTVHDLVISANPSQPPYSLVLLRKLLRDAGLPVYSTTHVHSNVREVNERLSSIFMEQPLDERRNHTLAFTLHWKDVSSPTLMVNPLRQTQIYSEVNIVRYISRLFPLASPYNYEATGTFTTITETDQLLDQLEQKLAVGDNKQRHSILRLLNGRLGKNSFLMGNTCGVVDIVAWSLMKQCDLHVGAPNNVARWYKTLSSLAGMDSEMETTKSKEPPRAEKLKPQKVSTERKISEPVANTVTVNGEISKKKHMGRADLESYLKGLGIAYQVTDHEEVFTVEALMKAVTEKNIPGLHMKNLFLKDKKKKDLYLLSARHNVEVKLNDVAKQVGVKELRFADESVMQEVIGVAQGCVTPFALANDKEHKVTMLLDLVALEPSHLYVNFHPLTNSATMGVSPKDLHRFLEATGHEPKLLNFT
ncbi:hypothetical protein Pmani_007727 [Petrolisthes manimaculis]|uniref:PrdX deacylase domain-containing protein 1 n=1 Tax=Petrolisthes manimaculis TaxID=1843537 RepID=A0AAE1UFD0_9EUCA|nr:hypothetical protein Pmani_007727 [Petrolisthes manimaculis]